MPISRRRLLYGAAGVSACAALASWRYWPDQGLVNPCRAELPPRLADHELVRSAWEGIDPALVWDCHVHVAGVGDSGPGIWINPRMQSLLYPLQYAQRLFYLNAGCARNAPGGIDASYVERMHNLVDQMRPGCKLMLLAFDRYHNENGVHEPERTPFYVADAHAMRLAHEHARYFEWVASIHPYRPDCIEALEYAASNGARAIKWLPAAMGIDPASARCDRFYEALRRIGMPLITHAGMERAVPVEDRQHYGNPLKLRRALGHGVKVVVAHCATMGQDRDIDRGPDGPLVDSFDLFARLMDEPAHGSTLFGELSAIAQMNRAEPALAMILQRTHWHARLLNGSDYPLPGIMPLFSLNQLARLKLLAPDAIPVLTEIRQHNPLLFDLVLKRHLRYDGKAFPRSVFETRRFFDTKSSAAR